MAAVHRVSVAHAGGATNVDEPPVHPDGHPGDVINESMNGY